MGKNFRFIIISMIAIIIIITFFNISSLNEEINEKQYNQLISDLSKVSSSFITWISNKEESLLTARDIVNNFDYDDVQQYSTENPYLNINNHKKDLSQVYIGLNDGRFITGGLWEPPSDYDPRQRVWYEEAIETDTINVSPVYIDRETGDQLITISQSLYMNDEFVGVMAADVFLNNISEYLNSVLTNDNFYIYLTDKEGTIIVHTDKADMVNKNIFTDDLNNAVLEYFNQSKGTSEAIRMKYTFEDKLIQGIVQNVNNGNWYIAVASVNDTTIFTGLSMSKNNIFLNTLMIVTILILIFRITRMKLDLDKQNESLVIDNEKDFLTQIYNRRYFDLYMNELLKSNSNSISILMIDVDNFKGYNDTYGHIKGDDILKIVANTINSGIRKEDVFARYGGEEFILLLKNVDTDSSLKIAEKLRASIENLSIPHKVSPYQVITISIGILSLNADQTSNLSHMVDLADTALYKAKELGRNRIQLSEESK